MDNLEIKNGRVFKILPDGSRQEIVDKANRWTKVMALRDRKLGEIATAAEVGGESIELDQSIGAPEIDAPEGQVSWRRKRIDGGSKRRKSG